MFLKVSQRNSAQSKKKKKYNMTPFLVEYHKKAGRGEFYLAVHNVEQFIQQFVSILRYILLVSHPTAQGIQPHSLFGLLHTWKSPQNMNF